MAPSIDEHAPHHRTPRDLDVIGHRYAVQPLPARRVAQHVHVAGAQGDAKGAALRRLVPRPREHEQRAGAAEAHGRQHIARKKAALSTK